MVEAHARSVQDYLIDGLSYRLSPGASYVTNRRSVSYFPSGSDTYSPSSCVKVIRINVNGTDWLDPITCKVQFDITNNHASNSIYFLSCTLSFKHCVFHKLSSATVENTNKEL